MKKQTKERIWKYFRIFTILVLLIFTFSSSTPYRFTLADETGGEGDILVGEGEYGDTQNKKDAIDEKYAKIDKKVSHGTIPGEYYVDLTIEGKDSKKIETADIVLVLDNSNSMNNYVTGSSEKRVTVAKTATSNFVTTLLDNSPTGMNSHEKFRVALVTYGSVVLDGRKNNAINNTSGNTNDLTSDNFTQQATDITNLIPGNVPTDRGRGNDGGTFTQQALEEAGKFLNDKSEADHKIIITITDGVPTFSYGDQGKIIGTGGDYRIDPNDPNKGTNGDGTRQEAQELKNKGYELFTIAVDLVKSQVESQGATLDEAKKLMEDISSSPEHMYDANSVQGIYDALNDIITRISKTVSGGSVTDPMGEYFILKGANSWNKATDIDLTNGDYYLSATKDGNPNSALLEGVTVNVENGNQIKIDGLNLGEGEIVKLRYKVQADTEKEGFEANKFYNTNGETILNPKSYNENIKHIFPEPKATAKGIKVEGVKIWDDFGLKENRPDSITVHLMREGKTEPVRTATVEPDNDGSWEYYFDDVIWYDSQGNSINYYF